MLGHLERMPSIESSLGIATATAILLAVATHAPLAHAQPPTLVSAHPTAAGYAAPTGDDPSRLSETTRRSRGAAGVYWGGAALGNAAGGGLEFDARYRWASGVQLGLGIDGQAASHAYFGGTKAEGVVGGAVKALALFPIITAGLVEFDVRIATGFGYARDVGRRVTPYREALRSVSELSWLAHVPIATASLLRAGATFTFDMETKPTQALADQALLLTLGFGHQLGPRTLLYATVDAGGTYGFDGDNGKTITRGALGLRWSWDGAAIAAF